MYERLTDRRIAHGGFIEYKNYDKFAKLPNEREIYDRLCEIEDKICEGRMVELPCKVGDKMYLINASRTRIKPYIVTHLEVCESGIKIFGRQIGCNGEHWLCWDSDLGDNDWVFLTEAQANKKLKESENEQR